MSDPENHGDDDYLVFLAPAEHYNTLSSSPFLNYIYALCALGEYTTVLDWIFGRKYHFSHTGAPLLENKLLLQGYPESSVKIDSYLQTRRVPPDALAYPRDKVATVSLASYDVELNCLHSDLHFGPRQNYSETHRLQHVSWLRQGGETIFFPEGAAVLGWTRRENNGQSVGRNHQRVAKRRKVEN